MAKTHRRSPSGHRGDNSQHLIFQSMTNRFVEIRSGFFCKVLFSRLNLESVFYTFEVKPRKRFLLKNKSFLFLGHCTRFNLEIVI